MAIESIETHRISLATPMMVTVVAVDVSDAAAIGAGGLRMTSVQPADRHLMDVLKRGAKVTSGSTSPVLGANDTFEINYDIRGDAVTIRGIRSYRSGMQWGDLWTSPPPLPPAPGPKERAAVWDRQAMAAMRDATENALFGSPFGGKEYQFMREYMGNSEPEYSGYQTNGKQPAYADFKEPVEPPYAQRIRSVKEAKAKAKAEAALAAAQKPMKREPEPEPEPEAEPTSRFAELIMPKDDEE